MTGLIDVLHPLSEGARLTGAWLDTRSGVTPVADRCLVAHYVELPDGAQGETESRFISHHLELAAEHDILTGGVQRAVEIGVVDEIVEPVATRRRIAEVMKKTPGVRGLHGNIPL